MVRDWSTFPLRKRLKKLDLFNPEKNRLSGYLTAAASIYRDIDKKAEPGCLLRCISVISR